MVLSDPGGGQPELQDPWVGRVLDGKYTLTRLLGDGGMGAVYEGLQRRLGRKVAVKVLHSMLARTERGRLRFEVEARATAAIVHPNIVEVIDLGELDDGAVYLVMELLDGRDLGAEIQAGPLALDRTIHIAQQVCAALEAIHAKGVVHRDLKPANVFLTAREGDRDFVKVLDFGIAKVAAATAELLTAHTATGQIMGTPLYMSPEQARGRSDVDRQTDVYALGAIVLEMLTGQPLYEINSVPDLLLQICHGRQPRLRDRRPDLPVELDDLVARMIARERKDRFGTAAEVADALVPFGGTPVAPARGPAAGPGATMGPVERASDRELAAAATELDLRGPVSDVPPRPASPSIAAASPPDLQAAAPHAAPPQPLSTDRAPPGAASAASRPSISALPRRPLGAPVLAAIALAVVLAGSLVAWVARDSWSATASVETPTRPEPMAEPRDRTAPVTTDVPRVEESDRTVAEPAPGPTLPPEGAEPADQPASVGAGRRTRGERTAGSARRSATSGEAPPAPPTEPAPDPRAGPPPTEAEPAPPSVAPPPPVPPPPTAPAATPPRPPGQRDIIRLVGPDPPSPR